MSIKQFSSVSLTGTLVSAELRSPDSTFYRFTIEHQHASNKTMKVVFQTNQRCIVEAMEQERLYIGREISVTGGMGSLIFDDNGTQLLTLSNAMVHDDGFHLTKGDEERCFIPSINQRNGS